MAQIGKTEREREVREQYEEITDKLFNDRQAFKDFLSFSGKHYKLPSDHAMMIFQTNPKADKEFAGKQSEEFSVKLNGKIFTERTEAADVLAKEIQRCVVKHDEIKLGEYKGFEITLSPPTMLTASYATINLKRDGGLNYSTNVEFISNLGDLTRMENIIKLGIDKEIANCENTISRDKSDIEQATKTLTQPFEFADELAKKSARLEQLNNELDCGRNEEVFISEDNDREENPPELNQDKPIPKHPKR